MTAKEREKSDRRVLWIVAGGVTAAAVAIAMLAGMSAQYGEEKDRIRRAGAAPPIRDVAPVPRAMPATTTRTAPPQAPTRPEPQKDPGPAEQPGSRITIDPEKDPMREGLAAFAAGDYERSAAYLEAEVAERPGRAYSHYILGLALWKSESPEQAEAALVRSAELNEGSLKTWVNLARVRNELGSTDDALAAARRAVELDDASASAHFLLARSLYNSGDPAVALEELQASLTFDPELGYAHNLAGLIYLESDRITEAEAAFARAAAILPGVAYVQNNHGMALELSGRTDDAVMAYRRAVDADPDHVKSAANLLRLDPRREGEALESTDGERFVATADPNVGEANGTGTR